MQHGGLGVSKVADLEARRGAAVEQRVLELEVPVADVHGVAEAHPAHQLLEEVAGLVLVEPAGLADALEQLTAGRVLHHDRQVRRGQNHLLETDDVGVPKGTVVNDLAENVLVDLLGLDWIVSLSGIHSP